MGKDKTTVTVHDGPFQADEVFGCALLTKYYLKPGEYKIQRTRNMDKINASDIVLDVGEIYNPRQMRFDHHQGGAETIRDWGHSDAGIVPSSAGLILDWLYDHHDAKQTAELPARLVAKMYRMLIHGIDAIDNGIAQTEGEMKYIPFNVSNLISMYNHTDAFSTHQRFRFEDAMREARKIIDHIDSSYWRDRANEEHVKAKVDMQHDTHLKLDKWIPGVFGILRSLKALDKYERVVWPQTDGEGNQEYRVQVPPKAVNSFELGAAPLDGSKVREKDLVFVHKAGFIGATRTESAAYLL
tara:strand:- start:3293 stop:4186 length:894 start_codon:yes stop_codon:yes gene_type:complete